MGLAGHARRSAMPSQEARATVFGASSSPSRPSVCYGYCARRNSLTGARRPRPPQSLPQRRQTQVSRRHRRARGPASPRSATDRRLRPIHTSSPRQCRFRASPRPRSPSRSPVPFVQRCHSSRHIHRDRVQACRKVHSGRHYYQSVERAGSMANEFDIVIRGGTVMDGNGGTPFVADIAVKDGKIAAIGGTINNSGADEIDARGLSVTPGFVDIHTHYDGQAMWDSCLAPSSWHGVTTVVMGNCGVGFAPVRKNTHDAVVALMEGVEDLPGPCLNEGLDWTWESFAEYLTALERR